MPVLTKLPPGSGILKNIAYPPLRGLFFFLFSYLPYFPIRRVNKPDLSGPFIWASSHSNFLCDVVPAGYEGPMPTKFLGKSTLFRFPIRGFIEFCGALPVVRPEDVKGQSREGRSIQNRSTFKAAIAAMRDGWPIAIFPEGTSIVAPGLVLPLKPGVAKLAFAAESENDFRLGLRIIPVGLEYGSRRTIASGLTIRYGNPIHLKDFKDQFDTDEDEAVQQLLKLLTNEMVSVFPHFKDEHTETLGKKLYALGLAPSKHAIAQLFLRKENDVAFWDGLDKKLRAFEETTKDKKIPVAAWGHRRKWKHLGVAERRIRGAFLLAGLPLALLDLFNNSVPEFMLSSVVDYVAVDETELMTIRFLASPVVLSITYAFQFLFLKMFVFDQALSKAGYLEYFGYALASFILWYFAVHWRRQLKRYLSLFYFWKAGIDANSTAVECYRMLRDHLGEV